MHGGDLVACGRDSGQRRCTAAGKDPICPTRRRPPGRSNECEGSVPANALSGEAPGRPGSLSCGGRRCRYRPHQGALPVFPAVHRLRTWLLEVSPMDQRFSCWSRCQFPDRLTGSQLGRMVPSSLHLACCPCGSGRVVHLAARYHASRFVMLTRKNGFSFSAGSIANSCDVLFGS